MQRGDMILFYVSTTRKWTATATISSEYFEDYAPIWEPTSRGEQYAFRVNLQPDIRLNEGQYIDAMFLAPRLDYLRRWTPEDWPAGLRGAPAPDPSEGLSADRGRDVQGDRPPPAAAEAAQTQTEARCTLRRQGRCGRRAILIPPGEAGGPARHRAEQQRTRGTVRGLGGGAGEVCRSAALQAEERASPKPSS